MPKKHPQVIDLRKIERAPEKTAKEIKTEPPKKTKHIYVVPRDYPRKFASTNKIEWAAPEFVKYKKERNWFVLPGFFALIIIIIAFLLKNFLLVIATILAAFAVYVYAKKEPRKIKFSISGKGIRVANRIYRFDDLKSFWIFYEPPEVKEISIRSSKMFMPYIKIPLGDQNPVEIRRLLLKFLPERKHQESLIDTWMKRIRF